MPKQVESRKSKVKSLPLLLFFFLLFFGRGFLAHASDWKVDTWVGTIADDVNLPNVFTRSTFATALEDARDVAVDSNRNVYITERHRIIRVNSLGTLQVVAGTTAAGDSVGIGEETRFQSPRGISFDVAERYLYIADSLNRKIKRLDTFSQTVATFYSFSSFEPYDIALDNEGWVYVVGNSSNMINNGPKVYRISPDGFSLTTYAGSSSYCTDANPVNCNSLANQGPLTAKFISPIRSITINRDNGNLFVADDDYIRLVTSEVVGTLVNDDNSLTQFSEPQGLSTDAEGNVYLADTGNSQLWKISPDGELSEFMGGEGGYVDGALLAARVNQPKGLVVAPSGNLFITDGGNMRVRRVFQENPPTPTFTHTPTSSSSSSDPTDTPTIYSTPNRGIYKAQWISQTTGIGGGNAPIRIHPGKSANIIARFKNRGTSTWFKDTARDDFVAFYVYKDPVYSTPREYNNPLSPNFGRSYFANALWGRSFDGKTEYARAATLDQDALYPGETGTFAFTFTAPPGAPPTIHREDLSLAYGPYWMPNPYNGDPKNVAHVWFPLEIVE